MAVHCLVGTINEVTVSLLQKNYSLRKNDFSIDHQSCISPNSKFLYDSFNHVTTLKFGSNFGYHPNYFNFIETWTSCFLSDKQLLAVGSANFNNYIEVWNLANDKLFTTLSDKNFDDKYEINCISFSHTFFPKFDSLHELTYQIIHQEI